MLIAISPKENCAKWIIPEHKYLIKKLNPKETNKKNGRYFEIEDDSGFILHCHERNCGHLNYKGIWTIIEE